MTRNRDDPFAVLGLTRTATTAQIGHAYRALLRRHHPDTRTLGDDNEHDVALREVLNAYADLRDRARRDAYDRDRSIRPEPRQTVEHTFPVTVLGHVNPSITVSPTWISPYGSEPARPAPINLVIALLEALPRGLPESRRD